MPKIKGKQMDSMKSLKQSLKKSGGGKGFIKFIGDEGLTVRFLTEPEDWYSYDEHYDPGLKTSYPCIEGECPGCEQDLRRSSKYLAIVVNRADDKVESLKLPKSLANRLVAKFDKYETLMDRDFELSRAGSGLDTEYDVDAEPVSKFPHSKYEEQMPDLEEVLQAAWDQAFGDDDDDDEDDEPPRRRGVTKKATKRALPVKKATGKRVAPRKATGRTIPAKKAAGKKTAARRRVVR